MESVADELGERRMVDAYKVHFEMVMYYILLFRNIIKLFEKDNQFARKRSTIPKAIYPDITTKTNSNGFN